MVDWLKSHPGAWFTWSMDDLLRSQHGAWLTCSMVDLVEVSAWSMVDLEHVESVEHRLKLNTYSLVSLLEIC